MQKFKLIKFDREIFTNLRTSKRALIIDIIKILCEKISDFNFD